MGEGQARAIVHPHPQKIITVLSDDSSETILKSRTYCSLIQNKLNLCYNNENHCAKK
jgi:hypothetical protein